MNRESIREYVARQQERYHKATRAEKGRILEEVVAVTDYHCQGRCENVPAGRSKTVPLNAVEWASRFVGRWRSGSVR